MINAVDKITKCENCYANFSYNDDDLYQVKGGLGFYCLNCSKPIVIRPMDNFKYPQVFERTDGKNLNDEEINDMVKHVRDSLYASCEIVDFRIETEGNTLVLGYKDEDSINIFVAKDYSESVIYR